MNITDSILEGNACLPIDLSLQHFLCKSRVFNIFLSSFFIHVPINQLNLPENLILNSSFKLILVALLFLQHISDLLTDTDIKIFFHPSFGFIWLILLSFLYFFLQLSDLLLDHFMNVRILIDDLIHLFAVVFFLRRFDRLRVLCSEGLDFVVVFVQGHDHLSHTLHLLEEFFIDALVIMLLVLLSFLEFVFRGC